MTNATAGQVVTVVTKTARKSRTIWLNGLTVLASLVAIVADALDVMEGVGMALPPDVLKYVLLALGLANIILRRVTVAPLAGAVVSQGGRRVT